MKDDDLEAREARAKRLREQIEDLKGREKRTAEENAQRPRSPRDFIQERMRELREGDPGVDSE